MLEDIQGGSFFMAYRWHLENHKIYKVAYIKINKTNSRYLLL